MQYKIQTQNNKGAVLEYIEIEDGSMDGLLDVVKKIWVKHPTAIFASITVARPDPEVVAIKERLVKLCADHHAIHATDLANRLFNTFDIKLKGKDNV